MLVKRGVFVFIAAFAAFYLKDLVLPDLRGWANILLPAAMGGSIGYLGVLASREKKCS